MIDQFVTIIFHFFRSIGTGGIFSSMFIENIGIPLPTEIGYLLGQDMVNAGRHSYFFIIFILTLGHVSGSIVSYYVGRLGDNYVTNKIKSNKRIVIVQQKLKSWYKRYGDLTVFLTRFVGYVRPWSSFVAGFSGVKLVPFLVWTTLGSLIFNIFTLYFTSIFILVWRRYAFLHVILILGAFTLFFGFIIYETIKWLISLKKKE